MTQKKLHPAQGPQARTLKFFVYYRVLFGIVVLFLAFLPLGFAR